MTGERGVVGRADDLARIHTVLDGAVAEQPGLVLLLGEAGVGKTTMLRSALGLATERGFATATGACAAGASGTSFAPFRAALRVLGSEFDGRVLAAALDASPAANTLLPVGLRSGRIDIRPDVGELYDAVLELIGALAAERPLLVAFEDLHWADRSTLELLSFLARNLGGERAVLVGTVRTDDLAVDGPTGRTLTELGRLGTTTRVDLRGLDVASLHELVSTTAADVDVDDVTTLHERTGGNPFFALELVEAGAVGSGPLPPSVTQAIELRLGVLDESTLATVRVAAVAGTADAALLAAVLGCGVQDVETALHEAVGAGVVVTDAESGEVSFRHALIREVAYAGLLTSERRRLHNAVAGALEGVDGTDAALLAHHYSAANRPADALRTSIRAARAEAGAYGSVDAVEHYVRAVEVWNVVPPADRPTDPLLDDLLQEAMVCALNVGTMEQGAQLGSRLLDELDPSMDPERWALYAARQSELRWELGDSDGAVALLDRAEQHLDGRSDSVARVRVLERRAFQAIVTGKRREGLDIARNALSIARRVGDQEAIVVALNRVALATTSLGEREGRDLLIAAFDEASAARLPHEVARAGVNLLLLLHTGCRLEDAAVAGERVLAAASELAVGPSNRAALEALYARVLTDTGEWDRAGDLLAAARLPNAQRLRTYVAIAVAELAAAKGDVELARRALREGRFDLIFVLALRRACLDAELALVESAPPVARSVADEYLPLAEFILDSSYVRLSTLALLSLPLDDRVAADHYLAGAERRAAAVDAAPVGPPADQAPWLAAARARHATIAGQPARALWRDAVTGFARAGLVMRRAWVQVEEARAAIEEDGDRSAAASLVADAHGFATRVGAQPIRRAAEDLVRRSRLDVPGVARLAEGSLGLTARESEVLRLVAEGRTNREIADALYISPKTASVHVSNILRKVGATTRGEAAAIAHREGLTEPSRPSVS